MEPASNKSAFKLRSGNKPSMAKMAGVSPMKQDKKFKATFTQEKKKDKKTDFPKYAEKPIGNEKDKFNLKDIPKTENTPKSGGNLKDNMKYMKPVLGDSKKIKNIKSKINPF